MFFHASGPASGPSSSSSSSSLILATLFLYQHQAASAPPRRSPRRRPAPPRRASWVPSPLNSPISWLFASAFDKTNLLLHVFSSTMWFSFSSSSCVWLSLQICSWVRQSFWYFWYSLSSTSLASLIFFHSSVLFAKSLCTSWMSFSGNGFVDLANFRSFSVWPENIIFSVGSDGL